MKHYMDISRIKDEGYDGITESNTGCFEVGDHINITEKWDGANASIQLDTDGSLLAFSRKKQLDYKDTLRGFWNYVQSLDANKFQDLGNRVCFGEWGVGHTVKYRQDAYNKWYVFDMYDLDTGQWLPQTEVKAFAESHGLEYIHVLYDGAFISWDHCKTFLNSPAYGEFQEGIIIKSQSKLNSSDVRQPFYLKIVNDSFKETKIKNHIKKILDPEHLAEKLKAEEEAKTVVTKARVEKELYKMIDEGILPEKLQPQDMGMIAKILPSRVFKDVMKEESDTIDISNKYIGKAINALAIGFAKEIVIH